MWRIVLYLVAVLAMALLCIFVVEQHGVVSLSLGSHVYEISLAVVILVVVASAAGALPCLCASAVRAAPAGRGLRLVSRAPPGQGQRGDLQGSRGRRLGGFPCRGAPCASGGTIRRARTSGAFAQGASGSALRQSRGREGRLRAHGRDFRYARARPARPLRRGAAPRRPQGRASARGASGRRSTCSCLGRMRRP